MDVGVCSSVCGRNQSDNCPGFGSREEGRCLRRLTRVLIEPASRGFYASRRREKKVKSIQKNEELKNTFSKALQILERSSYAYSVQIKHRDSCKMRRPKQLEE